MGIWSLMALVHTEYYTIGWANDHAKLESKGLFHEGRPAKYKESVYFNEGHLRLHHGKLVSYACSWPNTKGKVSIRRSLLVLFTVWVKPLRPEDIWFWEVVGVFEHCN